MAASNQHHLGAPGASAHAKAVSIRRRRESRAAQRSAAARVLRTIFGPTAAERRSMAEERSWSVGATGEEILAAELARRCPGVVVLHDLRIPGTRANIDHVAVAASGVFVIDAKRYRGRIRVERSWRGHDRLTIAGRDRTKLIAGLDRQVSLLKEALDREATAAVPVHGCLCFLQHEGRFSEVGLPVMRTLRLDGYSLYHCRHLAKRLNQAGPLDRSRAIALRALIAARFPPAAGG